MKAALIVGLGSVAVVAAVIVVATFLSRTDTTHAPLGESELSWVAGYAAWARSGPDSCVGIPHGPTRRIARLEQQARAACLGRAPWSRFQRTLSSLLVSGRRLPVRRGLVAESHVDRELGRVAAAMAHRTVEARCWSGDDWYHVNLERQAITGQVHFWAAGVAAPGVVHLDGPLACDPLARFYELHATPSRNNDRARLATALVVLAHEAEHNRNFRNTEAKVECYAVQHVRLLVRAAGRTRAFAADIAAYAWDVTYIRGDPVYSTTQCHDGGPLDLHPASRLWP
jgi:hypothetical protein